MALSRQPSDLKNRVITCLNKLSDRDTLTIASNELESIAKSLSNDSFAPFLACLSTTDSSEKSPVRRQCVRLITVLSASHGDALSPHLSKLLSSVLRRLRDPDSAVRSACVEAVSSISSHVTKPPFSSILKPLLDCVFHEQDYNAQIGASLCLAAAVEAAPEPNTTELKKQLPKLIKLVKNDCFKAKPALLSLMGCIVSVGGASSKNAVNNLIPCVVDFLTSEDWAARKAAAETLVKLAVAERNLSAKHKSSCLASLENRKFDKVKVVRETMHRALDAWKEVSDITDEGLSQSQSNSSIKDTGSSEHSPAISRSPSDSEYQTPQTKKPITVTGRSPTSSTSFTTSSQRRSPPKSDNGKPNVARSSKSEFKKSSDWNNEVNVRQPASPELGCEDGQKSQNIVNSRSMESVNCFNLRSEAKRVLFPKSSDDKSRKFSNFKLRSRVVPFCEDENLKANVSDEDNNATEGLFVGQKEFEDVSLICKQLAQIEHQQSNLMELLQRFIGSSQNGMNSLEKRVKGLEKAIDEMSHDLAISTRRVSDTDSAGNACCMLAGAEFLSPKFWRKTEGQSSNSKFSFSNRSQSNTTHNMLNLTNSETTKMESPRNIYKETKEALESHSNKRIHNKIQADKKLQACSAGGLDRASLANCMQQKASATGCISLR